MVVPSFSSSSNSRRYGRGGLGTRGGVYGSASQSSAAVWMKSGAGVMMLLWLIHWVLFSGAWSWSGRGEVVEDELAAALTSSSAKLRLRVFQALSISSPAGSSAAGSSSSSSSEYDRDRMAAMITAESVFADSPYKLEHVMTTPFQRKDFLSRRGHECMPSSQQDGESNAVFERYAGLVKAHRAHYATELWKFCVLYLHGGAVLDKDSPLLQTFPDLLASAWGDDVADLVNAYHAEAAGDGQQEDDDDYFWGPLAEEEDEDENEGGEGQDESKKSSGQAEVQQAAARNLTPQQIRRHALLAKLPKIAVLGDDSQKALFANTVHGSLLVIPAPRSPVAQSMVSFYVDWYTHGMLDTSPLLPSKALYELIQLQMAKDEPLEPGLNRGDDHEAWMLWQLNCRVDPLLVEEDREQLLPDTTPQHSQGEGADDQTPKPPPRTTVTTATVVAPTSIPETYRLTQKCPTHDGYCCKVVDTQHDDVVLLSRYPLLPFQLLAPSRSFTQPYKLRKQKSGTDREAPYIATVSKDERLRSPPPKGRPNPTPSFYDILRENDCLPADKTCSGCLRNKKGAKCKDCRHVCRCYCQQLCKEPVPKKHLAKKYVLSPPPLARDPSRLVPRIVHQTWFERVSPVKYPNMSRLIESWRKSGWEYRFYDDNDAAEFLSRHFPPEVREAYDAIRPGAFKADLFRYCALLIHGGVYADMDVLLESHLDSAVPPDVGFMTPLDEPGKAVGHRMCLWNGFIASAPAHPFLANVIETVVNNIRNRFTSVDMDETLCPDPELSISHSYDTLFTAGPCILGASVNRLLGRHAQTSFEPGDLDIWEVEREEATKAGKQFNQPSTDPTGRRRHFVPGRTVILSQDKWDMGAHRFTWLEKNLVVAATDMPDYDDRDSLVTEATTNEGTSKKEAALVHYSKTHVREGIYGVEKLYIDRESANELIQIVVEKRRNFKAVMAAIGQHDPSAGGEGDDATTAS